MSRSFEMIPVGVFEVNCYLVPSPSGKILYIIDPGGDAEDIVRTAEKFSYEEAVILLTHAHIDHIAAVKKCADLLNVKRVYLHGEDKKMYESPANAIPPYYPAAENLPALAEFPPEDPALEICILPDIPPDASAITSKNIMPSFPEIPFSVLLWGGRIFPEEVRRLFWHL